MTDRVRKFTSNMILGALLAGLTVWLNWEKGVTTVHLLCDGFFVAAVMLLGIGIIHLIANKGAFRVMSYGVKVAAETALPFLGDENRGESFMDYRQRKEEKQKSPREMILAGGIYLIASIVLLVCYEQLPKV